MFTINQDAPSGRKAKRKKKESIEIIDPETKEVY